MNFVSSCLSDLILQDVKALYNKLYTKFFTYKPFTGTKTPETFFANNAAFLRDEYILFSIFLVQCFSERVRMQRSLSRSFPKERLNLGHTITNYHKAPIKRNNVGGLNNNK